MAWTVYTYMALVLIGLGQTSVNHGKEQKVNFWNVLIWQSIFMFLLYKGGFFDVL